LPRSRRQDRAEQAPVFFDRLAGIETDVDVQRLALTL
jgi:hypothetical protein